MNKIFHKLHQIMQSVDFIQKDKVNDFHKYSYASEEVIKKVLHKEFVDKKIIFVLDILNEKRENTLTCINVKYQFIDVESGEKFEGLFMGYGEDKGDKGLYKAITGAIKYILTTTFLIPTGNDPENEMPENYNKPDASQKKEIMSLLTKLGKIGVEGATKEEVEQAVKGTTDLSLIPKNFREIIQRLKVLNDPINES